ncbi:hypothetical protein GGTG_04651 [Gaeumannomyces tritici R3-111a-1]|uniref:Uncharacterized protein n=1 Tax=Gaeumannomyces tritici (strain R3-111a-1) TaxID=644352 RepID=J3NTQ1_GAET3|nr:hypothetical protein GGTG_04651 [Gaeumannomyces tritici R3-111a-1]EJT79566.1 hypothetical protein GGTG_04651 [Gaeumannomyces tritici R3-111a-1]
MALQLAAAKARLGKSQEYEDQAARETHQKYSIPSAWKSSHARASPQEGEVTRRPAKWVDIKAFTGVAGNQLRDGEMVTASRFLGIFCQRIHGHDRDCDWRFTETRVFCRVAGSTFSSRGWAPWLA